MQFGDWSSDVCSSDLIVRSLFESIRLCRCRYCNKRRHREQELDHSGGNQLTHPWKASVKVFTTTHALTKRSKVIPGAGPYPAATGPEATRMKVSTLCPAKSAQRRRPRSPYFCSTMDNSCGESLYPKLLKAEANSCPSIEPERSRSKCLNTSCQSLMYRQSPWNSVTRS